MKPLRLEIEGFGSFPGNEVIDFATLAHRGLFVVTGPTGAGKSTIFDAMVYALYGTLPGDRSVTEIRSQHVDHTTPTRVVLDFEIGGFAYRITRNPPYERVSKRGKGTATQTAGATLEAMGDETSVTTGSDACTERIKEIIGLEAAQFERVVLLPQGKFDQFLVSKDEVRQDLLSTLFGGAIYKSLTDRFRAVAERLQNALNEADSEIANHRAESWFALRKAQRVLALADDEELPNEAAGEGEEGAVPEDSEIGDALSLCKTAAADLERRSDEATKRASGDRQAATSASDLAERFRKAEELRREIAELEVRRNDIDVARGSVRASSAARPVWTAATKAAGARADSEATQAKELAARSDVMSIMRGLRCPSADDELATPVTVATEIADARTKVDLDSAALELVASTSDNVDKAAGNQLAAFEDLVSANTAKTAAQDGVAAAETRLKRAEPNAGGQEVANNALNAARGTLKARAALDGLRAASSGLLEAWKAASEQHEDAMRRYVANEAPRLAEKLTEGEPCPVCGSHDHPTPAVGMATADPIAYEEVLAAIDAQTNARVSVENNNSNILNAEKTLGEAALAAIETLSGAVSAAEANVMAAEAADQELSAANDELTAARGEATRAERALHTADSDFRSTCRALQTARAEAAVATSKVAGIDASDVERRRNLLADVDGVVRVFQSAVRDAGTAQDTFFRLSREAETALGESEFESIDAARDVLLAKDTEEQRARNVEAFDLALKEKEAALGAIEGLGIPEEEPDAESLRDAAATAEKHASTLSDRVTVVGEHLGACSDRLGQADRLAADTKSERERATMVRTVHETFSGKGAGVSMNLYRWVLAAELERVALAANDHLGRLTDRRYAVRPGEKLALNIFDAHTGAERSPKSLSGGERFQVSLALALGLADVVSHGGTGSGHSYDALFLDEGFGALDPDALDDAISALIALQAGGRIVGAITHVEAMKEQLHVGIEVRRRASGAGSTLVVHP